MDIFNDNRIVLTLDAGGTNFVFTAIQGGKAITKDVTLPSNGHNIELCLNTIKKGFKQQIELLDAKPVAISFAFPGPANYTNGIIGDLFNLPGFRGGVPLASILNSYFNLPVFINNDGDLYAYGEALGGILPEINRELEKAVNSKRYHNLIGLTLGTGFGGGIVSENKLFRGDNSLPGEVWICSNRRNSEVNAEELVSTRAVQREYARVAKIKYPNNLMPKDIASIAKGTREGNREAALEAFSMMGRALGDTIANLQTIFDSIVVIGGGITGASELYMPFVMEELNSTFSQTSGSKIPRLVQKVFNLDESNDRKAFFMDNSIEIEVKETGEKLFYNPEPHLAIATSKLGASQAISLGAYAFALSSLQGK
ncbi:MAG: ROK family protein [bacterium]